MNFIGKIEIVLYLLNLMVFSGEDYSKVFEEVFNEVKVVLQEFVQNCYFEVVQVWVKVLVIVE